MSSPIAQLVEQVAVNHLVASSSLARGAINFHLSTISISLIKSIPIFILDRSYVPIIFLRVAFVWSFVGFDIFEKHPVEWQVPNCR